MPPIEVRNSFLGAIGFFDVVSGFEENPGTYGLGPAFNTGFGGSLPHDGAMGRVFFYLHEWLKFMMHVGKYTSLMDP